ncbi:hypothetical protein HMPREF0497_0578 [Lentilactobacillus buchneri ATCC 11577]|nr:hypothetical protein HMPREF0497_0578 [Lentilactobacillus buchneri ATCC 11577]MCT3396357.1 fucose-binding lectin II [Lentilactobacillus hilgardii]
MKGSNGFMKNFKKVLMLSAVSLLTFGAVAPVATVNAASVKTATTGYQSTKVKASYSYAKKMLVKNKSGLSGKATALFSRKAYPATGATAGYSDFLLGLKGLGYHFTKTQRQRVAKNLVLNKKSTPADLANAIMGLKAVGYNPQSFRLAGTKKKVNLVSALYKKSMTKQTVNVQSQALIAVSMSSKFKRPSTAKFSKTSLSSLIVKNQQSNNGWAYNNTASAVDSDTTAMAVVSLARGKAGSPTVQSALQKGQSYLKGAVYDNGAYGYTYNGKNMPNANSTAEAIIAFSTKQNTLKYANSAFKDGQTASPLRAMLGYVNKTGSIKGAASQTLGVGQVNLANAAYRQAQKKHSVYSLN